MGDDAPRLFGIVAIPLLCLALTADYFDVARYFHGDEAVYYTMAESLAHDGDLRYERKDLLRSFERFNQGPQGVVLKGVHAAEGERVYYAKPYLYSWTIAPLVRWLEMNGAFVGGVLYFLISVGLAALWFRSRGFENALLTALGLFGASVGYLYAFWIQPELMNMTLVVAAYFLWRRFGATWSSTAALALLGAVTYSKIPTGVLAAPILGTLLLRGRWKALALGLVAFGGTAALLFGINWKATGEWNYQGGERSIFYFARRFPYQQPGRDPFFKSAGPGAPAPGGGAGAEPSPGGAEQPAEKAGASPPHPDQKADGPLDSRNLKKASGSGWSFGKAWDMYRFEPSMLWSNLGGFWVGRYSGHLLYFPLFVLWLIPALVRRPSLEDALIWLSTAGAMLTFLILAQDNYFGGSGTVGNRYFSMMLPPLLFTFRPLSRRLRLASLGLGFLLVGPMLAYPFMTMFHSGDHAARPPARWFPLELSLINSISIPSKNFVKLPFDEGRILAYLPDSGTWGWEQEGFFWTRGDAEAEVVLRAPFEPLDEAVLILETGSAPVSLEISGFVERRVVDVAAGGRVAIPLRFLEQYRHLSFYGGKPSFLYDLHLRTRGGFTPEGGGDSRYLGARVRFTAEPLELARAYLADRSFEEAARWARAAPAGDPALEVLFLALEGLGRRDEALEAAEAIWGRDHLLKSMARTAYLAGFSEKAYRLAREVALKFPGEAWPELVSARAVLGLGGGEAAAREHLLRAQALQDTFEARRMLLELDQGGAPASLAQRVGLAQTKSLCGIRLGDVLELEGMYVEFREGRLRGRLLFKALRAPAVEPATVFLHLLDAGAGRESLARAWAVDAWRGLRGKRTGTSLELGRFPVLPHLWLPDEEFVMAFEIELPEDVPAETVRRAWLGIGMVQGAAATRAEVRSSTATVFDNRALLEVKPSL